jgi:hypothetical protein
LISLKKNKIEIPASIKDEKYEKYLELNFDKVFFLKKELKIETRLKIKRTISIKVAPRKKNWYLIDQVL